MSNNLLASLLTTGVLLLAFSRSLGAEEVEITAEPSHHLAFENDYVRIFKVSVAPHSATLMHRHRHDYVFITIGDAWISNEVEGRDAVEAKLSDGTARFVRGDFAHVAKNLSDKPFRNVTIELLQDEKTRVQPSPWKQDSGEEEFSGGHRNIRFVKDAVRVSDIVLNPGAALPNGNAGPRLVVAVNAVELHGDTRGAAGEMLQPGDIKWEPKGMPISNTGQDPARLVVLEF